MNLSEIFRGAMTPAKWRALGEYLGGLEITGGAGTRTRRVGNKIIISAKRQHATPYPIAPFSVWVAVEDGKWKAFVTRGVVAERAIVKDDDTVIYHLPSGLLDQDGSPIGIEITSGQGLFVVVKVGTDGAIEAEGVSMAAEAADNVSVTHFVPAVADESGSAGTYKYRLGKFTLDGDTGTFTPDLAGSHISHWNDLPKFQKIAGDNDIFKKFDLDSRTYQTKGLSEWKRDYKHATKTIHIDDTGDELRFETWGENLDVQVYEFYMNTDGELEQATAPAEVLCFREGIFIGSFSDSDLPGSYGTVVTSRVSRLRTS